MTSTDLATRGLSDQQIQTRIDLNRKAGWGLEKGTSAQLNMVFLYCQKHQLLPGDDVTLYEGRPWLTLDGRVKLMRRHPEYRGFSCRPLSHDDKEAWGYQTDDIVIECTIRTSTWGEISARGKVSKEEAEGIQVQGRRMNPVARVHPVEMAEKRAISRAERTAFGMDAVLDEDELEGAALQIIEERNQPERIARNAQKYDETLGAEGDGEIPTTVPSLPETVDLALKANARLQAEAAEVGVKGLRPLRADASWSLKGIDAANKELEARIKSREGEAERQSTRQAGQIGFES